MLREPQLGAELEDVVGQVQRWVIRFHEVKFLWWLEGISAMSGHPTCRGATRCAPTNSNALLRKVATSLPPNRHLPNAEIRLELVVTVNNRLVPDGLELRQVLIE